MEYTPLSPFRRPITHAHLRMSERPCPSLPRDPVNKWELLRKLSKAQAVFGISERDVTVLQGLLSFFPDTALGGNAEMVIYPSNKAICERLNGMPCSTMRRHIARLVEAGLLGRRDSPNGKRYARKRGDDRVTFGFDLSPLYSRCDEIAQAAEAVMKTEDRVRRLREIVSLMRRDLAALADFGDEMQPGLGLWDQLRDTATLTARALRRKLSPDDLLQYQARIAPLLEQARSVIDGPETEEMGTSDARTEHHHQNTDKEYKNSEPPCPVIDPVLICPEPQSTSDDENQTDEMTQIPRIPLNLVIAGCPSLKTFFEKDIRHWHQLYNAACHVRSAMGIDASVWENAKRYMGPERASIVVAAMLERFAEIRSPGAYLRALTTKAAAGEFSCGPMIMALIGRRSAT